MISLVADQEQSEFIASVRDYLTRRLELTRVRECAETADGVGGVWDEYAEMGWLAVGVSEAAGGVGLSIIEEALLMIEAGRSLAPGPLRSTLLAARIAADAGDADLAGRLISGELRAGVALDDLAVDARPGDVVIRLGAAGTLIEEVRAGATLGALDPNTRCLRIEDSREVLRTDRSYLAPARLLAAAELLGVLEAIRDQSAAYARVRVQFGKPIGSFQAVKHRCADMAVAAYAVRAQTTFAAVHLDAGTDDAELQVDMALTIAATSARDSAKANILNHGGIGFTWEADPHLYLKRAVLLGRLFGAEGGVLDRILAAPRAA
ncbi:MAG: acyl-CoA dehydrogenase [Microbacterium sp.]